MAKMTPKQKRFCDEYLIDLNATQAAIRAGYSKKTAKSIANENLTKPYIQEYIKERIESKQNDLIASQDEILQYFTRVIRDKTDSEQVVTEGIGEGVSMARTIRVKPSEKDKLKAAENLAKYYNLFTEKVEVNADLDINIKVDYGEEE